MPSWDRPGGGDSGRDRPPSAPGMPPYGSYSQIYPPPARYRQEQGEGDTPDGRTRLRDKSLEERGAHGREGTGPAADGTDQPRDGGDHPRHPGDKSRETGDGTDKNADRDGDDALFERQDKLIEGQEEQIGGLISELGKRDTQIDRLKEENDLQADKIERLESEIETLKEGVTGPKEGIQKEKAPEGSADGGTDNTNDKNAERIKQLEGEVAESGAERRDLVGVISGQTKTIGRLESENETLKAKLADALAGKKDRDHPAEGAEQEDKPHAAGSRETDGAKQDVKTDVPWHKRALRLPSEKATAAFTGIVGAADTIAATTHGLTGSEAGVIGAVTTAAVGVYLWIKSAHDERRERKRNADQQQN